MSKEIKLTQGKVAIVSDCDYEELSKYNWHVSTPRGRIVAQRTAWIGKNKNVKMHRQIMNVTDPKLDVDHINGDTLDNRRENLRVCTRSQNSMNSRRQIDSGNTYKGVYRNRVGNWSARIHTSGKTISLGTYKTEKGAAIAYDKAAIKYFGEFARTNFPKSDYQEQQNPDENEMR